MQGGILMNSHILCPKYDFNVRATDYQQVRPIHKYTLVNSSGDGGPISGRFQTRSSLRQPITISDPSVTSRQPRRLRSHASTSQVIGKKSRDAE